MPDRAQPGFVDFLLDAVERDADGDLFCLKPEVAMKRYSGRTKLPEGFRRGAAGSLYIMPAGGGDPLYRRPPRV